MCDCNCESVRYEIDDRISEVRSELERNLESEIQQLKGEINQLKKYFDLKKCKENCNNLTKKKYNTSGLCYECFNKKFKN